MRVLDVAPAAVELAPATPPAMAEATMDASEVAAPPPAMSTAMSAAPAAAEPSSGTMHRAAQRSGESGSVRVVIRTDPWGSVWVDGRYIGRSPATVVLPVGSHELGGGVGHIMGTRRVRLTSRANQSFVVHVDYPGQ